MNADSAIPTESVEDWVSYGDAVLVMNVLSETALPVSEPERQAGEGLVNRTITVEVEDVLWQRDDTVSPPDQFTFVTYGWLLKEDDRVPMTTNNLPRLSPGDRFVAPMADYDDEGWAAMAMWMSLSGDRAMPAEGNAAAYQKSLADKSIDEVARIVEQTEPEPAAASLKDGDPAERYAAVAATEETRPGG